MGSLDGKKDSEPGRSVRVAELYERLRSVLADVPSDRIDALVERIEMQNLGEVLRKAIADSGKTHNAIAVAAGMSPIGIGRFVRGDRDIKLETASKIAGVLGFGLLKIDPEPITEAPAKKPAKKTAKKTPKRK